MYDSISGTHSVVLLLCVTTPSTLLFHLHAFFRFVYHLCRPFNVPIPFALIFLSFHTPSLPAPRSYSFQSAKSSSAVDPTRASQNCERPSNSDVLDRVLKGGNGERSKGAADDVAARLRGGGGTVIDVDQEGIVKVETMLD